MADPIARLVSSEILVIGDIMLDRYCLGNVERISPEAPVPVVKLAEISLRAGGAANVAANIAGLGSKPVLVGITGNDEEGQLIPNVIENAGIADSHIFRLNGRSTTTKTRIIAHSQQIARLDQESTHEISNSEADEIVAEIRPLLERARVIVLSDYSKGLLTPYLISHIVTYAKQSDTVVLVDPKGKDFAKYAGATLITPNEREAAIASGVEIEPDGSIEVAGRTLLETLDLKAVLITRGDKGMSLFERGKSVSQIDATARRVFDVTGAGDTAIATMATAMGSGLSFIESARIANIAAGLVVEKVGTTPISSAMLYAEYREAGGTVS